MLVWEVVGYALIAGKVVIKDWAALKRVAHEAKFRTLHTIKASLIVDAKYIDIPSSKHRPPIVLKCIQDNLHAKIEIPACASAIRIEAEIPLRATPTFGKSDIAYPFC